MQYIENNELREWVKFELKKTIFTKAHALAVQTGCDILVKLQDLSSPTAHQSYSTGPLRKAYNNCTLRRDPSEKSVSGETGLPLSDQAVQSDDASQIGIASQDPGGVGDMVTQESFTSDNDMQGEYSTEQNDNVVTQQQQDGTLPMHLTAVSNNSHVQDSTSNSESQQFDSEIVETPEVHIKEEPVDDVETIEDISPEADMKPPEEENLLNFEQQIHIPASHELPTFVHNVQQPPIVSRLARSTVPLSPKPYQCGVCHKAFRSVHVLQKHTQTFHTKSHQIKLAPRVSRGRGGRGRGSSHFLNRPSHQAPQTSTFPVFPGATGEQVPITSQQQDTLLQDIPGLSSQQMAQMAQMASSSSAQPFPTSTPVAVTPSTSDFSQGALFQSPGGAPSAASSSPMSQGRPSILEVITPFFKSPGKDPYKPPSGLPLVDIQHQVLKSPGPIVTLRSFTDNAPMRLRKVNLAEFLRAISGLRDYGDIHLLGDIPGLKGSTTVFVKKIPETLLECNLCPIALFTKRYHLPSPRAIGTGLKAELISLGLVTSEQLEGATNARRYVRRKSSPGSASKPPIVQ